MRPFVNDERQIVKDAGVASIDRCAFDLDKWATLHPGQD